MEQALVSYSLDGMEWNYLGDDTAPITPTHVGIISNHIGTVDVDSIVTVQWFRSTSGSNVSQRPPTGRRVKLWAG
jgi:hypothetical protein